MNHNSLKKARVADLLLDEQRTAEELSELLGTHYSIVNKRIRDLRDEGYVGIEEKTDGGANIYRVIDESGVWDEYGGYLDNIGAEL